MTGMAIERDFRKLALATQAELRRVATPHVKLIAVQPVAQRDRARHRPRRKALRDNRRLLRRAPAPPPPRSRQNLNTPETVPINWQITWQTSLPVSPERDRIIRLPSALARRGQRSAYATSFQPVSRALPVSASRQCSGSRPRCAPLHPPDEACRVVLERKFLGFPSNRKRFTLQYRDE